MMDAMAMAITRALADICCATQTVMVSPTVEIRTSLRDSAMLTGTVCVITGRILHPLREDHPEIQLGARRALSFEGTAGGLIIHPPFYLRRLQPLNCEPG